MNYKLITILILSLILFSCNNNEYNYKAGTVVYLKPDSMLFIIEGNNSNATFAKRTLYYGFYIDKIGVRHSKMIDQYLIFK